MESSACQQTVLIMGEHHVDVCVCVSVGAACMNREGAMFVLNLKSGTLLSFRGPPHALHLPSWRSHLVHVAQRNYCFKGSLHPNTFSHIVHEMFRF